MPGSFLILERHWGFYKRQKISNSKIILFLEYTFFASFLCFRCFDADAFSIFARSRVGVRLEPLPVDD